MNVARQVVSLLAARGLKMVTAESCTAGLIASCLAEVPGSGACLDVGFVTYSPSGKAGFLGVQQTTMQTYGLTSEAVAREMAEGALQQDAVCADVAVSNTGVADAVPPGGPSPGTQCFAWAYRLRGGEIVTFTETHQFSGSRNEIRRQAARYALSRVEHYFNKLGARR